MQNGAGEDNDLGDSEVKGIVSPGGGDSEVEGDSEA